MKTVYPTHPLPINAWFHYIKYINMLYTSARPANFGNGQTVNYRGFQITDKFDVIKDGKKIWRDFISTDQAKKFIDNSLSFKARADKQAALKKLSLSFGDSCELENGSEQAEKDADKINNNFENKYLL